MPKLIESINPEVAALLHAHAFQDKAEDLIAHPTLPRMSKDPTREPLRPAVGKTGHVLAAMPTKFEATDRVAAGPTDRVMQPFIIGPERAEEARTAKPMLPQREMEQHPGTFRASAANGEGYVRLRVRVTGDRMRILNVQHVEGPLAQPESIVGDRAYEVTLDGHRLSAEGIPDIGVQRSFPRPGQHEHHVTELQSFEFNVRVPRTAIHEASLDRLHINLYRFPDALRKPITGNAILSRQLGPQARVVAQIEGIRAQHIEPTAIEQLNKIFPSLKIR